MKKKVGGKIENKPEATFKVKDIIKEDDNYIYVPCDCPCHSSGGTIIHLEAHCCKDGIKKIEKKYVKSLGGME